MINTICKHIRNFFEYRTVEGEYTIENGSLSPSDFLSCGDMYLIRGSRKNDGVHTHPAQDLSDETFCGSVSVMAVPKEFLELVEDIEQYCAEEGSDPSPYISESFGGYSYTRLSNEDGQGVPWQRAFRTQLDLWRKI